MEFEGFSLVSEMGPAFRLVEPHVAIYKGTTPGLLDQFGIPYLGGGQIKIYFINQGLDSAASSPAV